MKNRKFLIILPSIAVGVIVILAAKPRFEAWRMYRDLAAASPPMELRPAPASVLDELARRQMHWRKVEEDPNLLIYGVPSPGKEGGDPMADFIALLTHDAPRFQFIMPASNTGPSEKLTMRGILAQTISDDRTLFYIGPAERPSEVFSLKKTSALMFVRDPLSVTILKEK